MKDEKISIEQICEIGLENARNFRQLGLHDAAVEQLKIVEKLLKDKVTPKGPVKGIG